MGKHKSNKILLKYTTEKSRASSHKDKGPKEIITKNTINKEMAKGRTRRKS